MSEETRKRKFGGGKSQKEARNFLLQKPNIHLQLIHWTEASCHSSHPPNDDKAQQCSDDGTAQSGKPPHISHGWLMPLPQHPYSELCPPSCWVKKSYFKPQGKEYNKWICIQTGGLCSLMDSLRNILPDTLQGVLCKEKTLTFHIK